MYLPRRVVVTTRRCVSGTRSAPSKFCPHPGTCRSRDLLPRPRQLPERRPSAACDSASSARSEATSAASTSYDGGSCSAGTPDPTGPRPPAAPTGHHRRAARPPTGPALATPARSGHDQQAMTSCPPLLLLDVDGVLNPFAAPACPPGYTEHDFFPGEEPIRLCLAHGAWLQELGTRFQVVWASAWGADANRLLAPLLHLPDFPMIVFPPVPFHPRDKLPAIIRYAGHRPLAWIDDALPPEAYTWATRRRTPTLLISIDPAEGLTRPAIDQALQWAETRRQNNQSQT